MNHTKSRFNVMTHPWMSIAALCSTQSLNFNMQVGLKTLGFFQFLTYKNLVFVYPYKSQLMSDCEQSYRAKLANILEKKNYLLYYDYDEHPVHYNAVSNLYL